MTEQAAAAATHNRIRTFLEGVSSLEKYAIDTRLHGSYKNSTNVARESDVDIGALSDQIYLYDVSGLPQDQLARFKETTSRGTFTFQDYRRDLLAALQTEYGSTVIDGNKAITIPGNTYRLPADVLPCVEFHHYWDYQQSPGRFATGIAFLTKDGNRIVNFPQQHFDNMTAKNTASGEYFKGCVRIAKRIRNDLVQEGIIDQRHSPSCYLESLLWNAPTTLYQGGYSTAMQDVLRHLYGRLDGGNTANFMQANNVYILFHDAFWSVPKAKELVTLIWNRIFK